MPVRAENRARYPKDWKAISLAIRARSGGRCECEGGCGLHRSKERGGLRRCTEVNGQPAKYAKGIVMLTVAHLDHTPEHCDPGNLKALCQRCHLRYDAEHHRKNASATRVRRKEERGQLTLRSEHG